MHRRGLYDLVDALMVDVRFCFSLNASRLLLLLLLPPSLIWFDN